MKPVEKQSIEGWTQASDIYENHWPVWGNGTGLVISGGDLSGNFYVMNHNNLFGTRKTLRGAANLADRIKNSLTTQSKPEGLCT